MRTGNRRAVGVQTAECEDDGIIITKHKMMFHIVTVDIVAIGALRKYDITKLIS